MAPSGKKCGCEVPAGVSKTSGNRLRIAFSKSGARPGGFELVENLDRLYHRRSLAVDARETVPANRHIPSGFGVVALECQKPGQQAGADIGACHLDEGDLAAEPGSKVGVAFAVLAVQPLCPCTM